MTWAEVRQMFQRFGQALRDLLTEAWHVEVSKGPPIGRLAKVAYGAKVPFALLRAVYREPELRERQRKAVVVQLGIIAAISVVFAPSALSGIGKVIDMGGEVKRTRNGVAVHLGNDADLHLKKEHPAPKVAVGEVHDAGPLLLATSLPEDSGVASADAGEERAEVKAASLRPARDDAPSATAEDDGSEEADPSDLEQAVNEGDASDGDDAEAPSESPSSPTLILALIASTLWGILKVADWLVMAFFREPNDALTHAISARLGVYEEECPPNPKIRFSFKWAIGRLKRQFVGLLAIGIAAPLLVLISVLPLVGSPAKTVLGAGWAFYWIAVLTTAKTGAAWPPRPAPGETEPPPSELGLGDPWFVRAWDHVVASPLGRWWLPRLYGRGLRRIVTRVASPAMTFEKAPWELVGLTLVRMVASVPLVSTFVRGSLPVAAAYLATGQSFSGVPKVPPAPESSAALVSLQGADAPSKETDAVETPDSPTRPET